VVRSWRLPPTPSDSQSDAKWKLNSKPPPDARSAGRKMICADAHRDDGRRFVVHAEDASVAFVELEAQCRNERCDRRGWWTRTRCHRPFDRGGRWNPSSSSYPSGVAIQRCQDMKVSANAQASKPMKTSKLTPTVRLSLSRWMGAPVPPASINAGLEIIQRVRANQSRLWASVKTMRDTERAPKDARRSGRSGTGAARDVGVRWKHRSCFTGPCSPRSLRFRRGAEEWFALRARRFTPYRA